MYHSVAHTKDVVKAATRIAKAEGVEGDELTLLLTAAWFHDSGYIVPAASGLMSCVIAAYARLWIYTRTDSEGAEMVVWRDAANS